MDLPTGLYEQLLTDDLVKRLDGVRHLDAAVGDVEVVGTLADHLGRALLRALEDLPAGQRVDRANQVLTDLGSADRLVAGPRQLLAVAREEQPGVWRLLQTRPAVPLSVLLC